jgi:hypothetical protein
VGEIAAAELLGRDRQVRHHPRALKRGDGPGVCLAGRAFPRPRRPGPAGPAA